MSHITIDVELLAGTDIENAIKEASMLAKNLNVAYICFDFNGSNISISQNPDVNDVVRQYHEQEKYIVG